MFGWFGWHFLKILICKGCMYIHIYIYVYIYIHTNGVGL